MWQTADVEYTIAGVEPWSREEGMPETWYITRDGKQHGPITDVEFRKLVELGHLKDTDFVWHDGAPDWMPGTQFLDRPPLAGKPWPSRPAGDGGEAPATEGAGLSGGRRVIVIAGGVVFAILAVVAAVFAIQMVMDGAFRSKPSRGGLWRAPDGIAALAVQPARDVAGRPFATSARVMAQRSNVGS